MAKIKLPLINENENLQKKFSYPEGLEFDTNRPLLIGVQGPYEFIVLDEKTYIISTKYKEKLMRGEKTAEESIDIKKKYFESSIVYHPFEKFNMEHFLNTIMSIDLKNTESVLDFYNNYGPIGDGKNGNNTTSRIFGIHLDTSNESFAFFNTEISLLRNLFLLYEAVKNEDEDFLRSFEHFPNVGYPSYRKIEDPTISKEKLFMIAKREILAAINRRSNLINPVVGFIDGEFTKFTTSSCLLGVFYTRLYEMVTENTKIRRCRYCGDYFKPRKDKANFCPPPEANEKSKCVNRYDSLVRRIAEWHFKDGLTVEEIQGKITKPKSRSIREIQSIIDNYNGKLRK